MAKLIILKLDGNLQQGYRVTLEIGEEGQRPDIEESATLPPCPALAAKVTQHWQDKYRNLVAPYRRPNPLPEQPSELVTDPVTAPPLNPRIKPQKITYGGSINDRIRDCQNSARELEALFLQWLEDDEKFRAETISAAAIATPIPVATAPEPPKSQNFRVIDKCLRTHLQHGEESRFLIRSADATLQQLPWHTWDLFQSFATEPSFGIPRLQPTQKQPRLENKRSVKILAILGHSDGINVAADEQFLKKLAPDIRFLVEPSRQIITNHLWEESWDIIFFAGHSETEGDTGKFYINPNEYLTIDELWYSLRTAVSNGLQVAIFNSCDGLGLAQRLINDFQIPHLIVMRDLVPDQVAQEFLKHFLSAFAGGRPFHLAAREARERLQGLEGQFPCASWLPIIYQNPLEAALYWRSLTDPHADPPEAAPETDSPAPSPTNPRPRFPRPSLKQVAAISLLVTTLVMGLRWLGALEPIELRAYDHLMRSRPTETLDPNLLILEVTAKDAETYGYPLGDGLLAEVLDTLQAANPLAIGLTFQRRQQWGTDQERQALIQQFDHSNLISMCSIDPDVDEVYGAPAELSNQQKQFQIGFANLVPDRALPGKTIRRQSLAYNPALAQQNSVCITGYGLPLLLVDQYLVATRGEEVALNSSAGGWQVGDTRLPPWPSRFGGYQSLQKGAEQMLLNYRNTPGAPAQTVTLDELLTGKVEPMTIKDRIILIGHNRRFEDVPTPLGEQPELYTYAHAVSNLIQVSEGERPLIMALTQGWDALLVLVMSGLVLLAGFCWDMGRMPYRLMVGLAGVFAAYFICRLAFVQGLWLPLTPMMLVIVASTLSYHHLSSLTLFRQLFNKRSTQ